MCVIIKESVCISAITEGVKSLFKKGNEKIIIPITTAAIIVGGYFIFDSTMDIYKFHDLNKYIVLIFNAIIPFLVYSIAEIKNIVSKSRNTMKESKTLER